jgi:hypothetical protein
MTVARPVLLHALLTIHGFSLPEALRRGVLGSQKAAFSVISLQHPRRYGRLGNGNYVSG